MHMQLFFYLLSKPLFLITQIRVRHLLLETLQQECRSAGAVGRCGKPFPGD
jgi:hypothetical protein